MIKVGIQGGRGSFSEQAANQFITNHGLENTMIEYLISSDNVLFSVENNEVDYGIFAMENAQGGVVIESVKALAKYRCQIIEMFHITVEQNLLTLENINLGEYEIFIQILENGDHVEPFGENIWSKSFILKIVQTESL